MAQAYDQNEFAVLHALPRHADESAAAVIVSYGQKDVDVAIPIFLLQQKSSRMVKATDSQFSDSIDKDKDTTMKSPWIAMRCEQPW